MCVCVSAENAADLQLMVDALDKACRKWGMDISISKTKLLVLGPTPTVAPEIKIRGTVIEAVSKFTYLGSIVSQEGWDQEIDARLGKAMNAYNAFRQPLFRNKTLSLNVRADLFRLFVMSTLLYGSETWALSTAQIAKLHSFHVRCLRDMTYTSRLDHLENAELYKKVKDMPIEEWLRGRMMQWLGHVERLPNSRLQHNLQRSKPTAQPVEKKHGGPPTRWGAIAEKHLHAALNPVKLADWRKSATDRAAWRALWRPRTANASSMAD